MMKLEPLHTYSGPNIFATDAVIVVKLTVGELECDRIHDKIKLIRARFPRWSNPLTDEKHQDVLALGKQLASLALWLLNDVRGFIRTANCLESNIGTLIFIGYHKANISELALRVAALIFEEIDGEKTQLLEKSINDFFSFCKKKHPDYQACILMQAARKMDIPVLPFLADTKFWQYGWGKKSKVFTESLSNDDGTIASIIAQNKSVSKSFFLSLGIPTPQNVLVTKVEDLEAAVLKISYPCVVKPLDNGGGRGVTANICSYQKLINAFNIAKDFSSNALMVEQFLPGSDYRLMTVGGKLIGAFRREPSQLVGDGESTIRQLIEVINSKRSINLRDSHYKRPILIDDVLSDHLENQVLELEHVLELGKRVSLRSNANLSTGGVCFDVTEQVHPTVKGLVEHMAAAVGLGTAGFDYITTDISRSPWETGGGFIEMNTTPSLDVPIAAGWSGEEIGKLVLGENVGRIPVELQLINAQVTDPFSEGSASSDTGHAVIWGNEVRVGTVVFKIESVGPWDAVTAALRNREINSIKIFSTIEQISTHGLPVDKVDKLMLNNNAVPNEWMKVLKDHSVELAS